MAEQSTDYLVVGGGVVGFSTAYMLMQAGFRVTVLERGSVGRESSWAGGGILSPLCLWDYPDEVNRLALRGMEVFGGFSETLYQATGIDPEYQRSGMLVLPPFDLNTALRWCALHGMNAEQHDDGLLLPDIAQVRNPRLMQALRVRVEQLGGCIVEQCEVREIVEKAGQVAHLATTQGNFSADAYIVTAGAWSSVLLGKHALQTDIKPIRGQMLLFKFDAPPIPHIVLQQDIYLIPRRDGHLLVGSTREDVGFDKSTTEEARTMLLQRAITLLPVLRDMPIIRHWAGLRPGSPGNIPTIGRHPYLPNLYINSGHYRYGVTMTPSSVEVLLNTLNGTPQAIDVSPYLWR